MMTCPYSGASVSRAEDCPEFSGGGGGGSGGGCANSYTSDCGADDEPEEEENPDCGWDEIYDSDSDGCVTRPLDDDPKKVAERVKDCGVPTANKYWNHSLLTIEYGTLPAGKPAGAGCSPKGNNPPTDIRLRFDRDQLVDGDMTWNWAANGTTHEFVHVGDYIRYNSCRPWLTQQGKADLEAAGFDDTQEGMHEWVYERAHDEFYNTFGVRAPTDPEYEASEHNKPLTCLFD